MYRDALDLNFFFWPALLIHLDGLHLGQRRQAVVSKGVPEDGILPIQVRRLVEADEELASVCPGPLVCHAHDAPGVVSERRFDLVFERLLPDGLAALRLGWRRAGLDHEVGDQAVEERAIVVARCAERQEVLLEEDRWSAGALLGAATLQQCDDALLPAGGIGRATRLGGLRHALAEDLNLDVAETGVQSDGHDGARGRSPASPWPRVVVEVEVEVVVV